MKKVILEVRCNEFSMRDENPNVPWSPAEIGADAARCRDAGASIVHFHARDPENGALASDPRLYAEAIREIRARSDLVIHPTLGATHVQDPLERVAHIPVLAADPATRPDIAPLDLASTNIDPYVPGEGFRVSDLVYCNPVAGIRAQAAALRRVGVRPEAVLWNVGSARLLGALLEDGTLEEPVLAEIALSDLLLSCHPATERGLDALLDFLPADRRIRWAVLVPGGSILPLVPAIVERGGHIAIGLGDAPFRELGCPRNDELVARAARLIRSAGGEPATPAEARNLLGIP